MHFEITVLVISRDSGRISKLYSSKAITMRPIQINKENQARSRETGKKNQAGIPAAGKEYQGGIALRSPRHV